MMTPTDLFLATALAMSLLCIAVLLALWQLHLSSRQWRRSQDRRLDQLERFVRDALDRRAEESHHEGSSGMPPEGAHPY